jgi:uridine kinase
MIGDVIHIKPEYIHTAREIAALCGSDFFGKRRIILVAGESGSGKSVTAISLQKVLLEQGVDALVLHQDDYFHLPPATNHSQREKNIAHVGMDEVNIALMQEHINAFKAEDTRITKPLVYYKENQILQETVNISPYTTLIVEGTYSFALRGADIRIFMERNYKDTIESRLARNRDVAGDFIEKVLEIEHRIISSMAAQADIVVRKNYQVEQV